MDNRAQISAELLIITAAIVAIAVLLIASLRSTASDSNSKLESLSKSALSEIKKITS
ncbi:MAG: class III signal peptide-containing protein [Candidatus Micrarchaeota archaeon]